VRPHATRCLCAALAALLCAAATTTRPAAGDILDRIAADLKGRSGLALDIGCGDASMAIAVARRTKLFVQCFDSDAAAVAKARKAIEASGLYDTRVAADASYDI